MMKIEWASNFAPDGSRRVPPPSTVHGWLAKWRGTLSGNEHLRSRGMAEMRKAAAYRKARRAYNRKKAEQSSSTGRGIFSFLSRKKAPVHRRSNRLSPRARVQSRPSQSSRHKGPQPSSGRRLTTTRKGAPGPRRPPPSRPRHQPQSSSRRIPGRR